MNHLLIIICCLLLFPIANTKHKRPTIYPKKGHIVVYSGTNLTLGCIGKEPVKWTFYDPLNKKLNNYTVSERITKSINNQYNYELIITVFNVSYHEMGFYSCHGKMVNYVNPKRSKTIFVYIREEEQLSFYPSAHQEIPASLNSIVPVPCRPTSPDVNVSLSYIFRDGRRYNMQVYSNGKVNEDEFPKDGSLIHFHPMMGFAIRMIDPFIMYYICSFQRNNRMELMYISRKPEKYEEFVPYIEGSYLFLVQLGEDFTINCTTIVNQNVKLEWIYPNLNTTRIKIVRYPPIQLIRFNRLLISSLTIKNITLKDEGEYQCKYSVSAKKTLLTKKYIAVIDKKQKQSPPKIINSIGNELKVNAKANITLICEGSQPVTWTYPQEFHTRMLYFFPKKNTKKAILSYKNESRNENIIYKSVLQLISVSNLNTGFYYCHGKETIKNHPYKSDTMYMFVKDDKNLKATRTSTGLEHYNKNSNITLPCRPSSPDVEVSLKIENKTSILSTYDPRIGFTVNMTFDTESLTIYCYFKLNGREENTKYILKYSKPSIFETHTYVEPPNDNIVYIGEVLTLYCRVMISNSIFENPIWQIPNLNRTDLNISVSSINIHQGKVLISKLTIKNIQKEDEGIYNCYLPNYPNNYNKLNLNYITVYDRFDVKPSIYGLKNNRTYFGADLILYCSIEVEHNFDFNIDWTVPNNKNNMTTNLEYIPNIYGTVGKSSLKIKNVTFEYEGNYTCTAFDSSNHTKFVVLDVTVESTVKPKITDSNMNGSTINMAIGQSVDMICIADGIPPPTVNWKKDGTIILKNYNTLLIPFVKPSDAGLYICNASSHVGWEIRIINLNVPIEEPIRLHVLIAIVCIIIIMIVILLVIIIIKRKKEKALRNELIKAGILNFETGELKDLNPKVNITDQALLLPYDRKWDIPRDRIKLGTELGVGNFGIVVKAEVFGIFRGETIKTVAVKMVKPNSDIICLKALISELKLMTHIGKHINIVNLLGACTENLTTRQLMVIVEYCKHGNLQNYLLKNRENFVDLINSQTGIIEIQSNRDNLLSTDVEQSEITTLDLVCWSFQIARGMEYLSSRKILHGDIAARNILLAEDNIVKISDFGLSKNMRKCTFYKKKYNKCPMPIKWMSIEAIRDGIFSTQSDVWSFGIVLWELFSLGRTPYPEMDTNLNFFQNISKGYRMDQPQFATREIYQIMLECWKTKPICRPSFTELVSKFRSLLQGNLHMHYIELDESYHNQSEDPDYFTALSHPDYLTDV